MDILVNRGLVGCIAPHISEVGVGVIIKVRFKNQPNPEEEENPYLFVFLQAVCTVVESIVLGSLSFMIYKDEGTYL